MKKKLHHAALWLCVDNSSSRDRETRRSLASINMGTCQRPGMPPRRSHISIAFLETLNRADSSTGPPSRSMITDVSLMAADTGTRCSDTQELSVPEDYPLPFRLRDNSDSRWNPPRMPRIRTQDEQGSIAFTRLQELFADMEWREDWVIDFLTREVTGPLEKSAPEKTVKAWFQRESIPPTHVFNIGEVLGILPGWIVDQTSLTKAACIVPGGLYERELERVNRRRPA